MTLRPHLLLAVSLCLIAVLYIPSVTRSFGDITSWAVSELHIRYAAGFVRRGLLGEVAFRLRETTGLATGTLFPALFILLTAIQAALLAALAWPLRVRPALFLLVLLAPALVLFPAYDYGGYLRKDAFIVIGVLTHAILVRRVLQERLTIRTYERFLMGALAPYLFVATLIHENQAIFLPAHGLLIVMALRPPALIPHIVRFQIPLFLPAVLAFAAAAIYRGTQADVDANCAGWARAVTTCDAMGALNWTYARVWDTVASILRAPAPLGIFVVSILLALVPPLAVRAAVQREDQAPPLLVFAAMAPQGVLFLLGWDWGRWIHMASFALTSIVLAGAVREPAGAARRPRTDAAVLLLVLAYVAYWRVNVCCLPTSLGGGLAHTLGRALSTVLS